MTPNIVSQSSMKVIGSALVDLFIKPDFDNNAVHVSFTPTEKYTKIDYRVNDGSECVSSGTIDTKQGEDKINFRIEIANFKSWTTEVPFLYKLHLTLHDTSGQSENLERTFGMTKAHVHDRIIYFNNKPLYVRGHIRGREAHDHPNLTGCSTTEFYENGIRLSKAYGFNFVRFHSRVPCEEFLEAADRLGFLCQVEIRPYYGKYQKERSLKGFDGDQELVSEQDWERMILMLRNHPCVLVYCMGNEIGNPGNNERVKIIRDLTKKLDPTRLFLDTCSRGEYDRDTVDLDVQHMSYFAPFGKHYDMFDDSIHLSIYGSVNGKPMKVQDVQGNSEYETKREVDLKFPLLAHEVCHYLVLRDPFKLREKFKQYSATEPWWIEELIKMIHAKGYQEQFKTMLKASTRYQYIWIKQCLESVRKSPLLQGFHMLQFADTDRYENANGFLDVFDDPKDISPEMVKHIISPTAIIADLPKRSFMGGKKIEIPIILSNFPEKELGSGTLKWSFKSKHSSHIDISSEMDQFDLNKSGVRKLCRIEINLPDIEEPQAVLFECELKDDLGTIVAWNSWDLWVFPNRPGRIKAFSISSDLRYVSLAKRYPQLNIFKDISNTEDLLVSQIFTPDVLKHIEQGKDALILYRLDENRDKIAPHEKFYLPSTWDRFKGVIWDRGHNCGGFIRTSPILKDFPNDGFIDWQFYNLIEDSDKIDLSDFPCKIEPVIEGVDKAVRDRYDVGRFELSELQSAYTMRKFAYLLEIRIAKARVIITGLNFKGIEQDEPATCWLFESLINHIKSDLFDPKASMSFEKFKSYLLQKGQSKRIKERMMTQYWQLDDAPLESKQYWKESEQWLRQND